MILEVFGFSFEKEKVKILLFTFYYPPDLSAGSFRSEALVKSLSKNISTRDEIHVVTTHPNRYDSHKVNAKDVEIIGDINIHRVNVPSHRSNMFSQAKIFFVFAWHAFRYSYKLKPDFIIGTTSRLMTGILAGFSALIVKCKYFIDMRDIFSESISDVLFEKFPLLRSLIKHFFLFFEKLLLKNASGVNIVSEGFYEYFQDHGIETSSWTFFPNGVDNDFIGRNFNANFLQSSTKKILYAGNIGSGQDLDLILPKVAQKIGSEFSFIIIGDGAKRSALEEKISNKNIENIKVISPMPRAQLLEYYLNSDILFLHLNNSPAFERVLPSKIFEYASIGKPIIAGISGYSAIFVKDNIKHVSLFTPGNVDECIQVIKDYESLNVDNESYLKFLENYSRDNIMKKMSDTIFEIATSSNHFVKNE